MTFVTEYCPTIVNKIARAMAGNAKVRLFCICYGCRNNLSNTQGILGITGNEVLAWEIIICHGK